MTKRFFVFFVMVVFFVACRPYNDGIPTAENKVEQPASLTVYPMPDSVDQVQNDNDSPEYPMPSPVIVTPAGTPPPFVLPTPEQDTGVVTGQLLASESGEPIEAQTVYLGSIIELDPGPGYILSLNEQKSPHVDTTTDGFFAFGQVPPGTYVLIVWTPFDARSVIDPVLGTEMEIIVTAGQTTDLGVVKVSNWP